jgi:O-antigen ligase
VILVFTPVCVGALPQLLRPGPVRRASLILLLTLAVACLVWTGSKAGWLLAVTLAVVALFRLRFSRRLKLGLAVVLVISGTGGFVWKYSDYLRGGAKSAAARMDYWEAALKVTTAHPIRGTGPGTFGKAYAPIKRPESEMAHLTHNDYLQQASDSGVPGFLLFAGFIVGAMVWAGRRVWSGGSAVRFAVWAGLLGGALQAGVEFGWYIPAISWCYMVLLGWLVGQPWNDLDRSNRQNLTSGLV